MKIDFNKIVYLQIGGELGKNNSLPLEYFANLAKNFQNLIDKIVENDLPIEESIIISNFKIELVDFRAGSAVPGFSFTKNITGNIVGDSIAQRRQVSKRFEELIQIIDKSDYTILKDVYPDARKRNEIVNSLYGFVESIKTPQASFVQYRANKIEPLYEVRRFKKKTKDGLLVKLEKETEKETDIKYGKVKIVTSGGKQRQYIQETYQVESTVLSHLFDNIEFNNRTYNFSNPLVCVLEKDSEGCIIENKNIGIVGAGQTREEAVNDFCQEFDYLYNRLQSLEESQLSKKMFRLKAFFNLIIESVS